MYIQFLLIFSLLLGFSIGNGLLSFKCLGLQKISHPSSVCVCGFADHKELTCIPAKTVYLLACI